MSKTNQYENPFAERYASSEMLYLFSPDFKFRTWRKLWITLARAEQKLGLPIQSSQIREMEKFQEQINYPSAQKFEKKFRHDVMSHIHAYGQQCPRAKSIIHWGATSSYVTDNTDLIQIKDGTRLILRRLLNVMDGLRNFVLIYKAQPTLAFTHFQAAQPTTVGKRFCLYLQDLVLDFQELEFFLTRLKFLGVKGTTGTQASFLALFKNEKKVDQLDQAVTQAMGFQKSFTISGQTYTRKVDSQILNVLSNIAQSASKFANDLRLLQHLKEAEEPFEEEQIGSSAMAYKRNPMRAERICALARFVMGLPLNTAMTHATQWFERTLDDSANKRLVIPQAFLGVDSILRIYQNILSGLVIYPDIIEQHLNQEMPFIATENLLMEAVRRGGDRQKLHEKIRRHAQTAAEQMKRSGQKNDLMERLIKDKEFPLKSEEIQRILDVRQYTGRSIVLAQRFIQQEVNPVLKKYRSLLDKKRVELKV